MCPVSVGSVFIVAYKDRRGEPPPHVASFRALPCRGLKSGIHCLSAELPRIDTHTQSLAHNYLLLWPKRHRSAPKIGHLLSNKKPSTRTAEPCYNGLLCLRPYAKANSVLTSRYVSIIPMQRNSLPCCHWHQQLRGHDKCEPRTSRLK